MNCVSDSQHGLLVCCPNKSDKPAIISNEMR
jgi:hypothetical protein